MTYGINPPHASEESVTTVSCTASVLTKADRLMETLIELESIKDCVYDLHLTIGAISSPQKGDTDKSPEQPEPIKLVEVIDYIPGATKSIADDIRGLLDDIRESLT